MQKRSIRIDNSGHDDLVLQEDAETIRLRQQLAIKTAVEAFNAANNRHQIVAEGQEELVDALAKLPDDLRQSPEALAVGTAIWEANAQEAQLQGFQAPEGVDLFARHRVRSCGHGTDRACLSCGRLLCEECAKGSAAGQPCPFCQGPVYLDAEERPPGGTNPDLWRDY